MTDIFKDMDENEQRALMDAMASLLDGMFNGEEQDDDGKRKRQYGFALFLFELHTSPRAHVRYCSNVPRDSMVEALETMWKKWKLH